MSQPDSLILKFVSSSSNFKVINSAIEPLMLNSRPRYAIGVSDLVVSSSIINTLSVQDDQRFVEQSDFTAPVVFETYKRAMSSTGIPGSLQGIEVSYGGYISSGSTYYNKAPNTYFSNTDQTGIGNIDFRTIESDYAILFIRLKYVDNNITSYGPKNSANDISSQVSAIVSYNSTIDIVHVLGENAPEVAIQSIDDSPVYNIFPIMIKIPLKSSVSQVNISYNDYSAVVKIINSPSSLDNFGFLAINRNNPNYDMGSSRDGRTFGLVLDNYGFWDILIAPESSISTADNGVFSFNGKSYNRISGNMDDKYIAGIGKPVIDAINNDILSFDSSMIPTPVISHISLIPVPGYQQVWALRIGPGVKAYLLSLRRASQGKSKDGCYVDVPIYFQAGITEAFGSCNVRIFNNVSCVFDYQFCDFFWNLGSPLAPPDAFAVSDGIVSSFSEYTNCDEGPKTIQDTSGNYSLEITTYFVMEIKKIPMLDNGSALLLIKSDTSSSVNLSMIFKPTSEVIKLLKGKGSANSEKPWEFECSDISRQDTINKSILYTNPSDYDDYEDNPTSIVREINIKPRFLLVQPRFGFPSIDETGSSSPSEKVIASIGFTFKDWLPALNDTDSWKEKMVFGVKYVIPFGQEQSDLSENFSIRFLYSEDRRLT